MKKCFFAAVFAVLGTGAVAQQGPAPAKTGALMGSATSS